MHLFQDEKATNDQEVEDRSNDRIKQDGANVGDKHPVYEINIFLSISESPNFHLFTCCEEHRLPPR